MAGYYEKRGKDKDGKTKYRLVVDVGADFMGKRHRRTKTVACTSDRQADKELARFYTECSAGKFAYAGKVSLTNMCEKYLSESVATHVKKSTYVSYSSIIRTKIAPLLGSHLIEKITSLHVQEWVNYLLNEKKLSPKSIKNAYAVLNDVMNTAVKWGFISDNPCHDIDLPKIRRKETDSYNSEEVRELISRLITLPSEQLSLKTSVLLTLFTGMRLGELSGLQWQNVNLDDGFIKIDKTRLHVANSGTYEDTPKTAKSKRVISIPGLCIDLLRKLKIQQMENRLLLGNLWENDQCYVFLNNTGSPLYPPYISQRFTRFLKREGLREINFHALRHTHTSMLADLDMNITQISKRLGHSQISTTQNIYMHIFEDREKEIADKLENTFATILPPKAKFQR